MPLTSAHQMIYIQGTDQARMTLAQIRDTHKRHGRCQLGLQDINKVLDSFLSIVDGIQERPTHSDSRRSQAHTFENIGAATHAAVDEDLELREDCGAVELAFEEGHDGWWGPEGGKVSMQRCKSKSEDDLRIEIAAAMVRKQHAVKTGVSAHLRILPALDTLHDNLTVPVLTQPSKFVPGKVRSDVATHQTA